MARKSTGGRRPRRCLTVTMPVTAADFTALLSALINSKGNTAECTKLSEKIGFMCWVVASDISKRGKDPASLISCPDDEALHLLAATLNKDIRAPDAAADIVEHLADLLRLAFFWNSTSVATVASSASGKAFLQQLVTFVAEDVPVLLLSIDKELAEADQLVAAAVAASESDEDEEAIFACQEKLHKLQSIREGLLSIVRLLAVLLRKAEHHPAALTYLRRELLLPKYKVWKQMVNPSQPGYIKDLAAAIAETLGEWLNAGVEAERVSMVVELAKHCRDGSIGKRRHVDASLAAAAAADPHLDAGVEDPKKNPAAGEGSRNPVAQRHRK